MINKPVSASEVTFALEDRETGARRVATREDIQNILGELGLEIVPRGMVDWGPAPDEDLMESRIVDLVAKLDELSKGPE